MKKHVFLSSLIVILVTTCPLSATRLWLPEQIKIGPTGPVYNCGKTPSLALLMGVQPVVSNYSSPSTYGLVRRTPMDWENWNAGLYAGNIAGDGERAVISSVPGLVNYAPNQQFYVGEAGFTPMSYQNGSWMSVGPQWTFSGGGMPAVVSADTFGRVHMASDGKLARVESNNTWSTPIDFFSGTGTGFGLRNISDLAISPSGEIALSGDNDNNEKMVVWFDYKQGTWEKRPLSLASSPINRQRIGLGWDNEGNLGVAYSETNGSSSLVKFDYLNIASGAWTSEVVYAPTSTPLNPFEGTALAFDRFNNPVIASGNYLIYDPVVPEPASILLFGLTAVALRRYRK